MPGMTRIAEEVETWPGVTASSGSRGEYSFKVGAREIGHLHGERVLHIGYPKAVWQELYDAGRIDYHPVFPGKPGFGARAIREDTEIGPHGATFEDGYRAAEICDAMLRSAEAGSRETVPYRS